MGSIAALFAVSLLFGVPRLATAQSSQDQVVRDLNDRQLILEAMARYGFALDAADGEAFANLFTDSAVVIAGGGDRYMGRSELIRLGKTAGIRPGSLWSDGAPPPIHHLFSNVAIDLNGDTANVRAYWIVVNGRTGTPVTQSMGRYEDKLVKRNGQWKFVERRIINETMATPPQGVPVTKSPISRQ